MFVNVSYTDVSGKPMYVAGKRRSGNHIRANVRVGPSRTKEDFDELCQAIARAWDHIIGAGLPKVRRSDPDRDTSLRSLILLGDLIGGLEAGFTLPAAGEDGAWMKENWTAFNKKAEEGDEEFAEMVKEVEERGLLEGGGGKVTMTEEERDRLQAKRIEEMMGWGDD